MCLQCRCQHGHRYAFLFTFKSNNLNCMNSFESSRSLIHPPYELQYAVSQTTPKAGKVFEIVAIMREVMSSDG